MQPFRFVLLKHPMLALAVGLAALALRLAVPAGFMPASDHGRYVLALCPGAGPAAAEPSSAAGPMPGMGHDDESEGQGPSSCAFADLALPAGDGAAAILLSAPLDFVMTTAPLLPDVLPENAALRLRPPPRGPPLPR